MTHCLIKVGSPPRLMVETMLTRRLQSIASDWQSKSDTGNMPQSLYDAISEGSEGAYQKKVIRNLARVSRIISDEGTIRKFSEFKTDWRYSHSIYGRTDTCTICGQSPIVENCVLVDDARKVEIVIGNKCVNRYMDILDPSSGQILDEEQRAAFLRNETKNAKDEHTRQMWTSENPNIMNDLSLYEEYMKSVPELRRLHAGISKRLVTHGFPGPKMRRQWQMFINTAPASKDKWERDEIERKHQMRIRAEKAAAQKEAFLKTLKHNRLAWHQESEKWLADTQEVICNKWEREARLKIARRLKNGQELSEALERFKKEMIIRTRLDDGDVVCDNEDFMLLRQMLDDRKLNGWEEAFARSVMGRIAAGSKITPSQQEMIDRLRGRNRQ